MPDQFSKPQIQADRKSDAFPAGRRIAGWLLAGCAAATFSSHLAASHPMAAIIAPLPEADAEAPLRERMKLFYDCYLTGEFRKAEQYVAPDSRDAFFNIAKETIRSYEISRIIFAEKARSAKVILVIKNPTVLGDQVVAAGIPLTAEWKWVDDDWYWSAPARGASRLPMASISSTALQTKTIPRNFAGFGVPLLDKPVLVLDPKSNFRDQTHLLNPSKRPLKFRIDYQGIPGVRLSPSEGELPPAASVEITAEGNQAALERQESKREGHILVRSTSAESGVTIQFYVQVVTE